MSPLSRAPCGGRVEYFALICVLLFAVPYAAAICGDNVVDVTEECDNNNQRGCTTNCLRDTAFYCAGSPSTCTKSYPIALTGTGVLTLSGSAAVDIPALQNAIAAVALNSVAASDVVIPAPGTSLTQTASGWTVPFQITFARQNAGVVPAVGANLRALGSLTNARVTAISFNNVCGNQQVELGETCEFQAGFTDGCSSNCGANAGYVCRANLVSTTVSGVTTQHVVCTLCSNGVLNAVGTAQVATEACDDGNVNPGDGCGRECLVESGYICSLNAVQRSVCTIGAGFVCGNGVVQTGESCDDGNAVNGDGCSSACGIEAGFTCTINVAGRSICFLGGTVVCGNAVVQSPEVCDDGNVLNGDGCSAGCAIEAGFTCATNTAGRSICVLLGGTCGNGVLQTGELCDDGNLINGDGCSIGCAPEAGFLCVTNAAGRSVCTLSGTGCGNGVVQSGEGCDDANLITGDGCSSVCTVESGYVCTTNAAQRSVCAFVGNQCGNSVVQTGEGCDDGNVVAGDGCSNACTVEAGFACATNTAGRSVCALIGTGGCGNGAINTGETCDDGNVVAGDGCSATCSIESGYTCNLVLGKSVCSLGTLAFTDAFDGDDDDSDELWWLILLLILLALCLLLALLWFCCRKKKPKAPPVYQEPMPMMPVVEPKPAPLYIHPPPEIQPSVRYEVYDTY